MNEKKGSKEETDTRDGKTITTPNVQRHRTNPNLSGIGDNLCSLISSKCIHNNFRSFDYYFVLSRLFTWTQIFFLLSALMK